VKRVLGIGELRERLTGKLSALSGPSGVGKSSLLNTVQPGLALRTGATSSAGSNVGRGRHTTVAGELVPLQGGGFVADTPGIRELGLWQVPPADLDWGFREFRPFIDQCYFQPCSHLHEPDCAVRDAVEQGLIDEARYASYVRLREELSSALVLR
jgi:ribosome biogenesis GTPase